MVNPSILNPLSKKGLFASEIEQALSAYFVKMNFDAGYVLWNEGETAEQMLSIIFGRLSTRCVVPRTAAALVSLAVQSKGGGTLEIISLPVFSREYAGLAGLTPESFSRGITKLADLGIIPRPGLFQKSIQ